MDGVNQWLPKEGSLAFLGGIWKYGGPHSDWQGLGGQRLVMLNISNAGDSWAEGHVFPPQMLIPCLLRRYLYRQKVL